MAAFSTNQVRQFYVVNAFNNNPTDIGDLSVAADNNKDFLSFVHKGYGGITRTDLINKDSIISISAVNGTKDGLVSKEIDVALDSTVNGGKPVIGQDYVLRIAFNQFVGMSDEDKYFKYGMVHAYTDDVNSFYKAMILSLWENFKAEGLPLLTFAAITTTSHGDTIPYNISKTEVQAILNNITEDITGICIYPNWEGLIADYRPGIKPLETVQYEVIPSTISVNGNDVVWGTTEKHIYTEGPNGYKIADLEYFCMGERGDQYRGIGWPNNVPTMYMVNPEDEYDIIDIHYAYSDGGVAVQKSEKTLTLAISEANHTVTNKILTLLNQFSGITVEPLS